MLLLETSGFIKSVQMQYVQMQYTVDKPEFFWRGGPVKGKNFGGIKLKSPYLFIELKFLIGESSCGETSPVPSPPLPSPPSPLYYLSATLISNCQ